MIYSNNILEMHAKCWDYLINIQKIDKTFYFAPRKINNLNRLEQGYFFLGNDDYLDISFWDGSDTIEKIHNIAWGVKSNGRCFISISSKDNANKVKYLEELVHILNQRTGNDFCHIKETKWWYEYPEEVYFLDSLQSFLNKEKPIIDEYIKRHKEIGINMLNSEFNKQYVLKRLQQNDNIKFEEKKRQEGIVSVSPSSYVKVLHHNELQNAMVEYLNSDSNNKSVTSEVDKVDITVKTITGETIFYELKTCDVKNAIRLAIGQLLEYCHYPDKNKADKLVIVTKYKPSRIIISYIQHIRHIYKIPIYYQQFDMNEKHLSDFY
ncbi:hypothetical protein SH1V18_38330 [Vallitalea longa]|uniref:Uncharacterized protein n=1 Tax=Vallitalea longa TaxID=2936439 RepID=A0A9W6DHD8_9FIRM|nr:hypothetical protein [Vallitalea longa]GKX31353.1 hypothetical protein SH1V18_38330 [Vallitalea longa]